MTPCFVLARDPERTARLLARLVEGMVGGVINNVTLCLERPNEELIALADAAGCDSAVAVPTEIAVPRQGQVFLFSDGAYPVSGWSDRIADRLAHRARHGGQEAQWFAPSGPFAGLLLRARLAAPLALQPVHGVLVDRERLRTTTAGSWAIQPHRNDGILAGFSERQPG